MLQEEGEHQYTYTGGSWKTLMDFILVEQELRIRNRDSTCILGEPAVTQHRLLVSDWHLKIKRQITKTTEGKVKWNNVGFIDEALEYMLRIYPSPELQWETIE